MSSTNHISATDSKYLKKSLSVFVATCLVVSLSPIAAFGSTTVGVRVEAPTQISKTEQIIPVEKDATDQPEASTSDTKEANTKAPDTATATTTGPNTQASTTDPTTPESVSQQVTADIPLTQSSTILQDGLEYTINPNNKSATLIGWYGSAPTGDIFIPSTIQDTTTSYTVEKIWGGAIS